MSRPSESTVKRLCLVSSNRCAFTGCQTPLIHNSKVTARISHIKAQSPRGPRYGPTQTEEQRHAFENLILLCGAHADVVDADDESYTVERLVAMKQAHESRAEPVSEPTANLINALLANSDIDARGATVVTSVNQQGGITAATVNINAAPEPRVRMKEVFANQSRDGLFHSRVELTVDSPYPPGNLYIRARAVSLASIALVPQRPGVVMSNSNTREGFGIASLQNPSGRIYLDLKSKAPERFEIEWDLQ